MSVIGPFPVSPDGQPSMSTDELNAKLAEKTARFEKNVEAVEAAYVEHEDFIADFDALIAELTDVVLPTDPHSRAGWAKRLESLRALRARAYELLLGPLPQDDPRDKPYDLRGGPTS